ncbi:MarR family winged helix-turn-helix transcriptional regulator [Phenylobacterium sp.]|uniref:MarR family winged helix-turn-helix transcriptional regulator n=1 Tax=Phenylobacterium sp. TaxID=1871053 RepID=UPI00272F3CB2|nr:MarR family transcriptional regulator [Phenylobacterium sp.]MDP1873737.1 MarR family transcriptional regulator [Phenylobacterium sp.]MDP3299831.1 MarR family transcriptional regulator [Phenylobacterium sp.]MDP3489637.1 MarR family transcriptional regulator [Phenylobacterium sp.]
MSAESALDPDQLAERLRPALLRVARRLRQEASKAGLSALDVLLLVEIKRQPGVGVSDLADAEQMSRPAMSTHIKRLEAAGWISRLSHASDGRRSGLTITPAGMAALAETRRLRNDWLAARLSALDPAARQALAEATGPLLALVEIPA